MLSHIKEVKSLYSAGNDFTSTSVDHVFTAIRGDGEYVIGCSWGNSRFYLYDVSRAEASELDAVVANGISIGGFMQQLKGKYESSSCEHATLTFLKGRMADVSQVLESASAIFAEAFMACVEVYHA